ncbi:hypothetical protein ES705_40701 [subsurface metagenome]
MKNKIGWCSMTFNPCWGCLNNCEYCYARKIAKRFGGIQFRKEWEYRTEHNMEYADVYFKLKNSLDLVNFKPTFLHSQFNKRFPKKSQRIFVGSMSEIYYWEEEWIEKIIEKIKQYPQHTFQFLTKFPGVYLWYKFPVNCWLGITITDTKNYDQTEYYKFKVSNPNNLKFVCFEPLLDEIDVNLEGVDWVILGAESGNRKGKIIPKRKWIESIVRYCKKNNIPIYLKDSILLGNIKNIYPEEIKMFPEVK